MCSAIGGQCTKSHAFSLSLLPVEDEDALPGHDEEILLIRLAVVHAVRLAGLEHGDAEAYLGELRLPLEHGSLAERVVSPPEDVARVDHEPAVALGQEPHLGLLRLGFGNAGHGSQPSWYADRSSGPKLA